MNKSKEDRYANKSKFSQNLSFFGMDLKICIKKHSLRFRCFFAKFVAAILIYNCPDF